jgi:phage terminase large subunit GpA-like protein
MAAPFSMYQVGAEAMLPPREITLSQWSDENVVLAGTAAAERGQWQTRPYQRDRWASSAQAIRASRSRVGVRELRAKSCVLAGNS